MDMKVYYRRLKDEQERIPTKEAVVVSTGTEDGGTSGVFTEVPKRTAARLIVEGRARLATDEEAEQFRADMREAKEKADRDHEAQQVAVQVSKAWVRQAVKE